LAEFVTALGAGEGGREGERWVSTERKAAKSSRNFPIKMHGPRQELRAPRACPSSYSAGSLPTTLIWSNRSAFGIKSGRQSMREAAEQRQSLKLYLSRTLTLVATNTLFWTLRSSQCKFLPLFAVQELSQLALSRTTSGVSRYRPCHKVAIRSAISFTDTRYEREMTYAAAL
jgi:hypothetical protein